MTTNTEILRSAQDRLLGITVSRHQGEMDFQKAYAAGARFALIRAGSIDSITGQCYTDYQFERNARLAPEIMPVCFWWFFRPQFSALLQANYFCDLLKSVNWHLPPALDVEVPGKGLAVAVKTALDRIEESLARAPMIYTRGEFWTTNVGLVYWAHLYRLWDARYTTDPHPWKDKRGQVIPKVKPISWDDWTFWQWSADGNGRGQEFGSPKEKGSDSICLEWFNGSRAELMLLARDGVAPPLPKPPTPTPPEPVAGWKESIDAWARTLGYAGPRP